MTATDAAAESKTATTTTDWASQLAALQASYPKVREPILAALLVLMQNPGADLDAAKARAAGNGVRITAASVAAARRLLARQDGAPAPAAAAKKSAPAPRRGRPARRTEPSLDIEDLVRATVERIQAQGNAEAERLHKAIRAAMELLDQALTSRK
ncbi:MAG: hypothetical protein U1E73_05160 [Planctomycetota bacterium]